MRIWIECSRMTPDEIEDTVRDARGLAEVFATIAEHMMKYLLRGKEAEGGVEQ